MNNKLTLEEIDVIIVDSDRISRQTIRNILSDHGIKHITMASNMRDMIAVLDVNSPDLLIVDHEMPDGDLSDFVHKLRHYETKYNPFLPIIATAWSPTHDTVRDIIQSGVDHIVSKPLSAGQLMQRIKVLALARKPFIVTSQYIGPERRKKDDERPSEATPVNVPNTLNIKATGSGEINPATLQAEVDACIKQVNIQKLERNAQQVSFLVDRIIPGLAMGGPDETTARSLDRLLYVSEDIARRMGGTPYAHVSELCNTMIDVTKRIIDAGDFPTPKDVELLKPVARSIQAGFDEKGEDAQRMAMEISKSVKGGQIKSQPH
ncbi:MAG: response regulator [Rhodospirillaceae bacterium]|nr:response regulator [Rhodospirillaceae bacterium]